MTVFSYIIPYRLQKELYFVIGIFTNTLAKVCFIREQVWQFSSQEWMVFNIINALVGFLPYMDIFLKTISTISLVPKNLGLFPVFPVHQI